MYVHTNVLISTLPHTQSVQFSSCGIRGNFLCVSVHIFMVKLFSNHKTDELL